MAPGSAFSSYEIRTRSPGRSGSGTTTPRRSDSGLTVIIDGRSRSAVGRHGCIRSMINFTGSGPGGTLSRTTRRSLSRLAVKNEVSRHRPSPVPAAGSAVSWPNRTRVIASSGQLSR
ncbi:hypothetical protein [Microlunatus sp. GCM10028923]|uniref:hypothetical protein n=1 Tax=Microlunatus sp. GCM10028923 TaxID=3273400 RepID=UPI00361D0367